MGEVRDHTVSTVEEDTITRIEAEEGFGECWGCGFFRPFSELSLLPVRGYRYSHAHICERCVRDGKHERHPSEDVPEN